MSEIPIAAPELGESERARVADVIDSGMLADGPEVRRFEAEFSAYCDAGHGVATSNGTTALHAALRAVGIGPGDRVVTTPFTFIATANAIRLCGAEPVFADIDPVTYTIDPAAVEDAIRRHGGDVDAILPVHLYGLPADMDALCALAETYDLAVVEDAAQAHGAEYRDRPVGAIGDAGCFSFYPTKNMTTGEGGMVVTDDEAVAARARQFINHGRAADDRHGYDHVEVGHNFRLTSLAAALGRTQLEKLPSYTERRRDHAATLSEALADAPGIEVPATPSDRRHVFHQYTVRCADRPVVQERLDDAGVGWGVYYPTAIHHQPAYDDRERVFPHAEGAAEEVLSLPVHPGLGEADVRTVAAAAGGTTAVAEGVADD